MREGKDEVDKGVFSGKRKKTPRGVEEKEVTGKEERKEKKEERRWLPGSDIACRCRAMDKGRHCQGLDPKKLGQIP